jgi:cbb3-type cytochrome oxidase maturation protein
MSVLYVLVPIALVLASVFVALFLWAVRRGQFDDLNTPGVRILTDDDAAPERQKRRQP